MSSGSVQISIAIIRVIGSVAVAYGAQVHRLHLNPAVFEQLNKKPAQ